MDINVNKLRSSVWCLLEYMKDVQGDSTALKELQSFIKKRHCKESDVEAIFKLLSEQFLCTKYTEAIAHTFEEFLLLIMAMAVPHDVDVNNFERYQEICIALAKLMHFSVEVRSYASNYFRNKPTPFLAQETSSVQSTHKKTKNTTENKPQDTLSLVKCCYQLLTADPAFFTNLWDWSPFIEQFMPRENEDIQKLYTNHVVAILTNMTVTQLNELNCAISPEVLLEFDHEQQNKFPQTTSANKCVNLKPIAEQQLKIDFNAAVTNVEGVLLPIFHRDNYKFYSHSDGLYDNIVKVDSTKVNLRSIALGIASGKPISLIGPVGCGKTTLVEYLARKTGRICPKKTEINEATFGIDVNGFDTLSSLNGNASEIELGTKRKAQIESLDVSKAAFQEGSVNGDGFLRIQLGDQTDSKMLLGQYHCTDVPGEFIWLPGVLTQAVMNGYWLLLEDLDTATQDTFTILSSLLEHNYLSVPGFRDCVKIEPGFQLFVTVRTNKSFTSSTQKSLYTLLEKYLYTINILPLSRNELCKVVSTNYPKLSTVANRIVDVFLTFSSGDHGSADNLRQGETSDRADTTDQYEVLPFEEVSLIPNSGRLVSTRDLIKLCQRSSPHFVVTSTECAYFVFQNAVDIFCSYLPQGKEKTALITSIGAKLGIIRSRCEFLANEYKPTVNVEVLRIRVGRAELTARTDHLALNIVHEKEKPSPEAAKRQKLDYENDVKQIVELMRKNTATFSFTRMASCLLERIAVCVLNADPVLLVGETGVGKTSSVQYLAERMLQKLVVVNMNNQSDASDLIGGFKPVDLSFVITPLYNEFATLFRSTFDTAKNDKFLAKMTITYQQANYAVLVRAMLVVFKSVFEKHANNVLSPERAALIPRWQELRTKVLKLDAQLSKSINISFAFIPGSLVKCIKNGDWLLLDEINLASAETLECLSTILEPEGSVVLIEKGDLTPVKRHPDFRIFACMNPNTDIGKKDLPIGIRNRFTEFFVDELTTTTDLQLLIGDYLHKMGISNKSVSNIVKLYKDLRELAKLQLNDGLGNRPVYSLRTLCRSLRICAKNLCGSIERNLYESFCLSFLTQLDPSSHLIVLEKIKQALLTNPKAVLNQRIPKPGDNYLDFEGYWIQCGTRPLQDCENYILTTSVKQNLKDLARIISIGKLPILLQGPTSAGKTSLIEYVAKRSGNYCLRINNHEHTDLQEYIGTYAADVTGQLSFKEGVLVQAMRNGFWIILDELNLASTEILEALNRVLDDNRELFIPETQQLIKAHPNFMLFATQNPPGLYGGRKMLSRAFKNRFIELHFSEIPRDELEIILEKRCLIPPSYAKKMVRCMSDLQKNRKTTSKNVFTLRDLFRWGNRYTYADKKLLEDQKYDWNQHLIEEGYLVLSAKVRTDIEIEIIEEALLKNFKKRVILERLFDIESTECSPVTRDIIDAIKAYKERTDIVWTRNMTRMAVLTAKALYFDEPVLLVGPTGCGKTTVCQILASIRGVQLRILNCHMHTEGADFLGGLRPCRRQALNKKDDKDDVKNSNKLFEWADGPLIQSMQEGSYFMADEISLAEDSVLERLNCILEPERTVLLAEKGGVASEDGEISTDFVVKASAGFQFLATMNPGGDFGKKELSPALRNRFTEIWCLPSDSKEDLIQIAKNFILENSASTSKEEALKIAQYLIANVFYIRSCVEKFKFSVRDILAWANYMVTNAHLSFPERAIFGLETIFLDALEMWPHESLDKIEQLKLDITKFAIKQAEKLLNEHFTLKKLQEKRGVSVIQERERFGIKPFFIPTNQSLPFKENKSFLFDVPTTKKNLFRLLSALSLKKPILLEGPPGVGKTSIVENIAHAIGYHIVRINLCEHTDLADLFGTDLPAEDNALEKCKITDDTPTVGSFVWRDGPLLAALKAENTWILLDELNLAPQSVLEGLNAILDHRGEVFIPELNKTFVLGKQTRIFACQNPLKQGGGRKGLPQSFLNRFNKVYLRKLVTKDLLHVVNKKYDSHFAQLRDHFTKLLPALETESVDLFDLFKNNKKFSTNSAKDGVPTSVTFDLSYKLVQFSEQLDQGITAMEFGYKGGPFEINLRDILRWCDSLVHPKTGYIASSCSTASEQPNTLASFQRNFQNFLLTLYERMKLVYYQRMRSELDKLFIRNAFGSVFNCDAEHLNALSEDIALYWTDEKLYFNDIVLERDVGAQALRALRNKDSYPLLLNSQREVLKNIVECVHLEKPVLVCGGTDTGKTKLIDTLCTLSNQVCNTDTIDDSVTGSFQQIDLNRHLEEIARKIEEILMATLQAVIFITAGKEVNIVTDLMKVWSDYNLLQRTKSEFSSSTAMSEELFIFRKRVQNLNAVIDKLLAASYEKFKAPLKKQKELLVLLKLHISNADTLNTGGSFEWVDSKIVKSLKCGQYILLEHANFCSSAVLDRLNSVLEPNGNLLISEKGVSANETAEVVEKTPNFRAFLTIDPKNGELSRAMRNRCVELALIKDAYTIDDKRMIIYTHGVQDIYAINCILEIHNRVEQLTDMSNLSISHLTRFAFLVASYKRIGFDMPRAIYISGVEVYVYTASVDLFGFGLDFYQNKLREIVLQETDSYSKIRKLKCNAQNHLSNIMLNSSELNTLKLIKLQAAPLNLLLIGESLEEAVSALQAHFVGFKNINFQAINAALCVEFYIYLLYQSSTMADVKLRHIYLQELLCAVQNNQLNNLNEKLYNCVKAFAPKFGNIELAKLPWNFMLFPRLREYTATIIDTTKNNVLSLSAKLLIQLLLPEIPEINRDMMEVSSPLMYSQAVQIYGPSSDKLNNIFLTQCAPFMINLREVIVKAEDFNIDVPDLVQLSIDFLWLRRLVAASQESLFINKHFEKQCLDQMILHFRWLEKNLLQLLERILPNFSKRQPKLATSLKLLKEYVMANRHPLILLQKHYSKELTQFQPFYQQEQCDYFEAAQQLDNLLNVVPTYGSYTVDFLIRKYKAQHVQAAQNCRALLNRNAVQKFHYNFNTLSFTQALEDPHLPKDIKMSLAGFNVIVKNTIETENEAIDFGMLQKELTSLTKFVTGDDEITSTEKLYFASVLEMIPLREYFLSKALVRALVGAVPANEFNLNVEYAENVDTLSNATWQAINLINSPLFQSFRKVWTKLLTHISNSSNTEIFHSIKGIYKYFNTYHRLVLNAATNQQLYNLSNRSSCLKVLDSQQAIDAIFTYEGPNLTNAIITLLFQSNGELKPVPLKSLPAWQQSLKQMCDLVWQNDVIMTPAFSMLQNNYKVALESATRLQLEVEYILTQVKITDEVNNPYTKQLLDLLDILKTCTSSMPVYSLNHLSIFYQELLYRTSLINALVGAIELSLLTYMPDIDPVKKQLLKKLYLQEDITQLRTILMAYDSLRVMCQYQSFGAEIYDAFSENRLRLEKKQQQYDQKLALRPDKCLYRKLFDDLTHYLKTNCSPEALSQQIVGIQNIWQELRPSSPHFCQEQLDASLDIIRKLQLWIANSQHFCNHILNPYKTHYQDFLQPLQCAIDQLRFGFEGFAIVLTQLSTSNATTSIRHKKFKIRNTNFLSSLHSVLANIAAFPTCHKLHISDFGARPTNLLTPLNSAAHDSFNLLRAKVLETHNFISIAKVITAQDFLELDHALDVCNKVWQNEEERRRVQKLEQESLYAQQTKCEAEDEELLDLQEIDEIFPTNVEEDFGEFMVQETLEKVEKIKKSQQIKGKTATLVNEPDYAFIAKHFINIFLQYTQLYYYKPNAQQGTTHLEYIEPFKMRMQVFVKLFHHYKTKVNEWLDEESYNSFAFSIGLQQQLLNETPAFASKQGRVYNYYKDANIPEIINCGDVMQRIEKRVHEQLDLYPEHAGLLDIQRVIERIRCLPSTSPVVRFNIGFQILREKVSRWNEIAHKNNNLNAEELEVAQFVQKWTKLELQFWRTCLTQTYEKVESKAYKYWFFIYNLLQEYMQGHELDNSYRDIKFAEKRFAGGEILDDVEVAEKSKLAASEIIRIFRQFVEASCFGDFHVRLQLLKSFEFYLCNMQQKDKNISLELTTGLRNLQIYFAQFEQEIEEAKKCKRVPIERKLKELVKIESYQKDLSYFSMRNNVARVHRNLHKFLKEYQLALQEKVTTVFQPQDATIRDYNCTDKLPSPNIDVTHFVAAAVSSPEDVVDLSNSLAVELTLLPKVDKLFDTSRHIVEETLKNAKYPARIAALNELLSEQLARCEHLRILSVDRSKERPRQVSEAKHILQQKRKGLADLFQVLAQLGISYKSGLMELSLRSDFDDYSLPAFCIKTMLPFDDNKELQLKLLQLNENLDKYYAKCSFKLKLLQNIMLTPLSELGPQNIARLKGFAVDLFIVVQQQRKLLATSAKDIYDMRGIVENLKEVAAFAKEEYNEESKQLLSQTHAHFLALQESLCRTQNFFEQFSLLLNCVPTQKNDQLSVLSNTECRMIQSSPYFEAITANCNSILQQTRAMLDEMRHKNGEFFSVKQLRAYQQKEHEIIKLIEKIRSCCSTKTGDYLPIARPIEDLLTFVMSNHKEAESKNNESSTVLQVDDIDKSLEQLIHNVLLSLQKLYKKYQQQKTDKSNTAAKEAEDDDSDDDVDLEDKHLKVQLLGELCTDWQVLNINQVKELLSTIVHSFKNTVITASHLPLLRRIATVLPILEQYKLLADYYIFQQLGAHKISVKMLSIMLTAFVEIGTKGFCVPPDLMQDEEGEQKQEERKGEGFGLEDGTGEKDASDKLESEDQLDDAKRPEDRKNEEKQEQKDLKEEKGIEMSDDFEGEAYDMEKNEEDDSGESEEDEDDVNKEMGETEEGAEKLDEQIWGDDEEPKEQEENEKDMEDEEQGKGTKDEKDSHNDLDGKNEAAKEDGIDEHEKDALDATEETSEKRKKEKDIDNMQDPEMDEEQNNPYHNELEEPPEAEEMDLGDMMNNNEDERDNEGDEQEDGDNPFDIDAMKENMPATEKEEDTGAADDENDKELSDKKEEGEDDESTDSDTDEENDEERLKPGENATDKAEQENEAEEDQEETETQTRGQQDMEEQAQNEDNAEEDKLHEKQKPEEHAQSKDKSSKEENVQSVPEEEPKGSADQVDVQDAEKDVEQEQKLDEQETGEEKDGVGHAENDDNTGHQGIADTQETVSKEERKNERQTKEKRKQGRTNEDRTLGEAEQNKLKQLKTIDRLQAQKDEGENETKEDDNKDVEAEEYQHVKEPKKSDKTTLDNATEEQSKQLKHKEDEQPNDEDEETIANEEEPMLVDEKEEEESAAAEQLEELNAEKYDKKSEKPSKSEQTNERAETQEKMEVEGEVVETLTVARSDDTTAHCNKDIILDNTTQAQELSAAETIELRKMYQQQINTNTISIPQQEDYESWQCISNRMSQNARELCEQLRLILEPIKCTRLKGDYRTGRRINLKKIIPYIASQFRKDKIWLRRTKPAQRDYKITIAIDDSKSMHHNNSKTLTLESVSLISQALTLLESGRLSVVSFGQSPQIVLNHTEQFDGPKLMKTLNFEQQSTKIAELLDFIRIVNSEESASGSDCALFENLLLILSDGRNIYSEGRSKVTNAIKLARMQRIFIVYIIIDNPDNKNSILDLTSLSILPDKRVEIKSYLDDFPFPYYVIVRDLNQLPLVLSEAMRQWFELVNSEQ